VKVSRVTVLADIRGNLWQKDSREDDVVHANSQNHHGTVERDKVPLVRDQEPGPALKQLDCTVDASDVYEGDAEDGGGNERAHGFANSRIPISRTPKEVGEAEQEDRDADELKEDSADHDVRAWFSVAVDLSRCDRGHATANGLKNK